MTLTRGVGGISDVQTYEESPGAERHAFGNHLVCHGEGEEDGLIIKYGKPKMCLTGPQFVLEDECFGGKEQEMGMRRWEQPRSEHRCCSWEY